MSGLLSLVALPVMLLNFLGGVVALVWLLVTGDWGTVGYGVLLTLTGTFLIGFALLPGIIFAAPALSIAQRVPLLGFFAVMIALGWTYIVMTFWCVGVFAFFLSRVHGNYVPYVLWSYACATGPWTYLAQKEMQSDSRAPAIITSMFAQLGCIGMMIAVAVGNGEQSTFGLLVFFVPFMIVSLLIQLAELFTSRRPVF